MRDIDQPDQMRLMHALIELGDKLRVRIDTATVAATAAKICGQTLAIGRAAYGVVDAPAGNVTFVRDWCRDDGMPSLAGSFHFEDFGAIFDDLKNGNVVAVSDVSSDPKTAAHRGAFRPIRVAAFLNVPLMRDGSLAGVFTVHHDEARQWAPEEVVFVRGVADRTWAAITTAQSIDELRRANDSLELEVEQRTTDRNAIWQLSSDVMLRATFSGVINAANPAWKEVLGWELDDIIGLNLFELVHPNDIERTMRGAAALSEGTGLARFDNRYRHRDGTYRWISWSARPGGDLINAVGRDITADRSHAMALRDLEDFSRLALSAVGGVGVWRFDVQTDLFHYDKNIAWLYAIDPAGGTKGISRSEFLANVLPEDIEALRLTMAGGLVTKGDLELEYRVRHPDGSIHWILSRGHTYFDDHGVAVRRTGVGVEMTRQRLLEQQLRQSQKLEAVGQLTGGLAHDFNNMLTTIGTSLDLLRRKLPPSALADYARYLDMATRGVTSAASLTQRLLAFSRNQSLDLRAVDVDRVACEMEELLRRSLGERVALRYELAAAGWLIHTDPHQLENALLNLAINARDAMPDGGNLIVTTSPVTIAARFDESPVDLAPGDYVAVSVIDDGVGMPAEIARRAFDPFFTTKDIGKGTGLGLSMIHGFAKQSGGDVSISSTVGVGTKVQLFLPRSRGGDESRTNRPMHASTPRGSGEHVLVVEDQPDVLQATMDALKNFGYRTSGAPDADAALVLLASEQVVDLLLTDVGLPGMTGRELANVARRSRPLLKVLFMTGYAKQAAVRGEFLDDGMDLIGKPFEIDDLVERIHSLIRPSAAKADDV